MSSASLERHEEKYASDTKSDTSSSSEDDTVLGYTEAPVVSMSSTTVPPASSQQHQQQPSEEIDIQTPAGQSGSGRHRSRALSVVGTSQLHQLNRQTNHGGYASVAHHDEDWEDEDEDDEDGSPAEELELGVLAKGSEGRGGWSVLLICSKECYWMLMMECRKMLGDDTDGAPGPSFQPLDRSEKLWMTLALVSVCIVTAISMYIVASGP